MASIIFLFSIQFVLATSYAFKDSKFLITPFRIFTFVLCLFFFHSVFHEFICQIKMHRAHLN